MRCPCVSRSSKPSCSRQIVLVNTDMPHITTSPMSADSRSTHYQVRISTSSPSLRSLYPTHSTLSTRRSTPTPTSPKPSSASAYHHSGSHRTMTPGKGTRRHTTWTRPARRSDNSIATGLPKDRASDTPHTHPFSPHCKTTFPKSRCHGAMNIVYSSLEQASGDWSSISAQLAIPSKGMRSPTISCWHQTTSSIAPDRPASTDSIHGL